MLPGQLTNKKKQIRAHPNSAGERSQQTTVQQSLETSLQDRGSLGSERVSSVALDKSLIVLHLSSYVGITIIFLCLLSLGRLEFIWGRDCLFVQFSLGSLILANIEPAGNMVRSKE